MCSNISCSNEHASEHTGVSILLKVRIKPGPSDHHETKNFAT